MWQLSRSVVNPSVQCPLAIPFVLSLLIGLLHVGVPFLTRFATDQQSQNLYAGWAMTKGQVPVCDDFTEPMVFSIIRSTGWEV